MRMRSPRLLAALATREAHFSACLKYRYTLTMKLRKNPWPLCIWIMANPSTADEQADDPTTRKVCGFTREMGFGSALVLNLCAFRTPHPRELVAALERGVDVVGPDNYAQIEHSLDHPNAMRVVYAWGNCLPFEDYSAISIARGRIQVLVNRAGFVPYCYARTQAGNPQHPLWLPKDSKPDYFPSGSQETLHLVEQGSMEARLRRLR